MERTSSHKELAPLFLIIFIDSLAYFLAIPVLLRLFVHGDYSLITASTSKATRDFLYGTIVALSPLAFLLTAPFVGNLSDRFGRKRVMLFSLIAGFSGFALSIIAIFLKSVSILAVGRLVAGASTGSQPIAQAAVADFTEGKRKAFYLSMIAFAMTLAMIVGPLLGTYFSDSHIVSWFNVMTPYWIGIGLMVLNILLLIYLYKDDKQVIYKPNTESMKAKVKNLFRIIFTKKIALLLLVFFLIEISWSQYYQSVPLFMGHRYHYHTNIISVFLAYSGIWMCIGLTIIYRLVIRILSVEKFFLLSLLMSCIGLAVCNIPGKAIIQWIGIIPVSIFIGTAYTSLLAIISNHTGKEHQGWVLGTCSTLLGASWMLTSFLSGWLINALVYLPDIIAVLTITAAMIISLTTLQIE